MEDGNGVWGLEMMLVLGLEFSILGRRAWNFDPDGDYIRRYVKELEHLDSKKIHDPYDKCDKVDFEKLGYRKPIVEHKFAR